MKKFLTLVMTLCLCLSIFSATSMKVEANTTTYSCIHGCGTSVEAEGETCELCSLGLNERWDQNEDGLTHDYVRYCGFSGCNYEETEENVTCTYPNRYCECNRYQGPCAHPYVEGHGWGCKNTVSTPGALCSDCTNADEVINKNRFDYDATTHTFVKECSYCAYYLGTVQGNHNFVEGICTECSYNPNATCAPSQNVTKKPESKPTEAEIHAQKTAEIEARQKKVVTTATGKEIKTEIGGVYEVNDLSGTAVNTPNLDVKKAIGLSEKQIEDGINASIYMSNYLEKEDRDALNNAATAAGKSVLSMVLADMYSITKEGIVTKIHNSKEPISLMFGLPEHAIDVNRIYSLICVTADGRTVELKDTDTDPSTITVDTTVFGKYVIVY